MLFAATTSVLAIRGARYLSYESNFSRSVSAITESGLPSENPWRRMTLMSSKVVPATASENCSILVPIHFLTFGSFTLNANVTPPSRRNRFPSPSTIVVTGGSSRRRSLFASAFLSMLMLSPTPFFATCSWTAFLLHPLYCASTCGPSLFNREITSASTDRKYPFICPETIFSQGPMRRTNDRHCLALLRADAFSSTSTPFGGGGGSGSSVPYWIKLNGIHGASPHGTVGLPLRFR